MTAIEFGVAGGRGLVALERNSREVEEELGVGIDVVGFDTGKGMPAPADFRDLPHVWQEGFFPMDEVRLRAKLKKAELVLGDVRDTVDEWVNARERAPLGFISFDLNFYASTKAAFRVFDRPAMGHLPRVICYFDNVASSNLSLMSEHVSELLAIKEFNGKNPLRQIAKIQHLRAARERWERWQHHMYAFHDFAHPAYVRRVAPSELGHTQLPL